jgi:TolB-like protein
MAVAPSATLAVAVATLLAYQLQPANFEAAAPKLPRVLVERFEDLSETEAVANLASGLSEEVIGQLSKFRDIVVVESADRSGTIPRYTLSGSVSISDQAFRLRVKLVNRSDGTCYGLTDTMVECTSPRSWMHRLTSLATSSPASLRPTASSISGTPRSASIRLPMTGQPTRARCTTTRIE